MTKRACSAFLESVIAKFAQVLSPYERGEKSRAEMARELGISERWLRRLLARERSEAEREGQEQAEPPYVEIVDGTSPPRPHYDLATRHKGPGGDRLEKPAGAFRISRGTGRGLSVQDAGRGEPITGQSEKPKPKPKPKPKARLTREEVDQIVSKVMTPKPRKSRRKQA